MFLRVCFSIEVCLFGQFCERLKRNMQTGTKIVTELMWITILSDNLPKSKADDLLSSLYKFQLENIPLIFQNPRDSNIHCRWNDPYLSSAYF